MKPPRLRRVADVAVVETTDEGQGDDAAVLGWLDGARLMKALQNDTRMVVLAAAHAQKAADLIIGHTKAPAVEQAA